MIYYNILWYHTTYYNLGNSVASELTERTRLPGQRPSTAQTAWQCCIDCVCLSCSFIFFVKLIQIYIYIYIYSILILKLFVIQTIHWIPGLGLPVRGLVLGLGLFRGFGFFTSTNLSKHTKIIWIIGFMYFLRCFHYLLSNTVFC